MMEMKKSGSRGGDDYDLVAMLNNHNDDDNHDDGDDDQNCIQGEGC